MILTIHIARKPVIGSVASNVLKWSTGGINIGASRISTGENLSGGAYAKEGQQRYDGAENWRYKREGGAGEYQQPLGRWPSNLIFSHLPGCERRGSKTIKGSRIDTRPDGDGGRDDKTQWRFRPTDATKRGYGATEEITDWDCRPDCPVCELDQQSGDRPSGGSDTQNPRQKGLYQDGLSSRVITPRTDRGGASRFFKQVKEE